VNRLIRHGHVDLVANSTSTHDQPRASATATRRGTSASGKRRQSRRRFRTAQEARNAYAAVRSAVNTGTHVARSRDTLSDAATGWLAGKRNLKPSTVAGYRDALKPVLAAYGAQPVQRLTKAQLDELVDALMTGTQTRSDGDPPAVVG
jgi:hypothetical protein